MPRFYFDHNATTPVSPAVLDVYLPALRDVYGNASSIHQIGQAARQRLEQSRREVASRLHVSPKEIIFTSGGTESNNLALFGVLRREPCIRRHLIVSAIEHPAILNPVEQLRREGVAVTTVPVGRDGRVSPSAIQDALRPETALVSVMHANNEIGTVQPVGEIAQVAHGARALLHVDGVQALGKIPVNVTELGADLYSVSAHKLYAPKGIGALYMRSGLALQPLQFGGRHEMGYRPGTENVAGAVAFGAACMQVDQEEAVRLAKLRDWLEATIQAQVPDTWVNAQGSARLPNTTSLGFHGIEGEAVVIALDLRGFAVSSGAACSSGAVEPSHVLTAIGLSKQQARSCVRISLGRDNTREQVEALAAALIQSAHHLRRLSPQVVQYA